MFIKSRKLYNHEMWECWLFAQIEKIVKMSDLKFSQGKIRSGFLLICIIITPMSEFLSIFPKIFFSRPKLKSNELML